MLLVARGGVKEWCGGFGFWIWHSVAFGAELSLFGAFRYDMRWRKGI